MEQTALSKNVPEIAQGEARVHNQAASANAIRDTMGSPVTRSALDLMPRPMKVEGITAQVMGAVQTTSACVKWAGSVVQTMHASYGAVQAQLTPLA